jgi:hypothetical protein
METYFIDLETIFQILQRLHHNGLLQGDLPARRFGNNVPWKAQLWLIEGKIDSCVILDQHDAVKSSGEAALRLLSEAGPVSWVLSSKAGGITGSLPVTSLGSATGALSSEPLPASAIPRQKPATRSFVPRRLITVTFEQMNRGRWPRNYRVVYAMIDGTRSPEQIANLLSLHPQEIAQIMRDLQGRGFISWDEGGKR